jgi:hypothetical protein
MRRLNNRGASAFEFCLVAGPLFVLMFAICDFGRYAITVQSLHALANAGARQWMICYQGKVIQSLPSSDCPSDPLPTQKQTIAPFSYSNHLPPTLNASQAGSLATVTASQPNFTMLMPVIWGTAWNAPSATTKIPLS